MSSIKIQKQDLTPIYLKAMERVERDVEYASCPAISIYYDDKNNSDGEPARLYARIFSPDGRCGGASSPFYQAVHSGPDPKGHRLLMLALASVCWRDFVKEHV